MRKIVINQEDWDPGRKPGEGTEKPESPEKNLRVGKYTNGPLDPIHPAPVSSFVLI